MAPKASRLRRWALPAGLAAAALLLAGGYLSFRALASRTEQWSPEPLVVRPGPYVPNPPPKGAVVLFGGGDLSQWQAMDGSPAGWDLRDGMVTVRKAAGNIETRRRFLDYTLHLEWRIPPGISGAGQMRGNSGLFLASTGSGDQGYEVQILDSFGNRTYVNGQAGAIYKQHAPLANPMRPPGEWQSYDVEWTAPRFAASGALASPARVTLRINGVLVQDNVALRGETVFLGEPAYHAHGASPIKLQAHRDASAPISFRNIWLLESPAHGP